MGTGDVRVETVPDPVIKQPTDAIVRIVRTCVCGSDLHGGWYGNTETGGLQAELARIPQANGSLVKVPDVDPNTADEALLASYSPSPTST